MKRLTKNKAELLEEEEVETGEPIQSEMPSRAGSPLEKNALADKLKVKKKLKLLGKKKKKKPKKVIKEDFQETGTSPFSQLLKNIRK